MRRLLELFSEAIKRPDGSDWYTDRGLLLPTRLDGPDGELNADLLGECQGRLGAAFFC
jgi:hypothetical protein